MSERDRIPKVPWAWIGPFGGFVGTAFLYVAWGFAIRGGGPWYSVALFEVCWLTLGGVLGWGFLRQALTKFTNSAVSQPTLRGRVTIPWSDVIEVRELAEGRVVEIQGSGRTIRVSPLFYAHWDEAWQWLLGRLPAAVRSRLTSA